MALRVNAAVPLAVIPISPPILLVCAYVRHPAWHLAQAATAIMKMSFQSMRLSFATVLLLRLLMSAMLLPRMMKLLWFLRLEMLRVLLALSKFAVWLLIMV